MDKYYVFVNGYPYGTTFICPEGAMEAVTRDWEWLKGLGPRTWVECYCMGPNITDDKDNKKELEWFLTIS